MHSTELVISMKIEVTYFAMLREQRGISTEQIETETTVVDILDYDVRFGQGFLFSPPRPVRAEALHGSAAEAKPGVDESPGALLAAS